MTFFLRLPLIILLFLTLAGCADKPVRHLASDASLIKAGSSTKKDVLTFLGDPDTEQMITPTTERWIYYEETKSTMQKTPYLGKLFSPKGYSQIVVTFEGDRVVDCRYSSFDSDEFNWSDDYSWQEKPQ